MREKTCMTCKHSGMDMDMDPYCAHPEVLKRMPYGQSLASPSAPTRSGRECDEYKLWEIRNESV